MNSDKHQCNHDKLVGEKWMQNNLWKESWGCSCGNISIVYTVKLPKPAINNTEMQGSFNSRGEWHGHNPFGMEAYFKRLHDNK